MPGARVEVRNLSRCFQLGAEEVWALRDVSVAVEPSEFVAFIGRSGSGKTTLLNLIAGLDRPTGGTVHIDSLRIDTMSEHDLNELRRHRLGFVFQSFGLLPPLSAYENVELPLRIAGFKHGERTKRTKRVLDMVGLGRRAEHRPYELSGGEQQRVAIARALATEPSLVLADEPTGELDSATAAAIFTLLRDVARAEGITIATCTHDRLVMEMADRIEELADGLIVTGQRDELWQSIRAKAHSPFASPLAIPELDEASQAASTLSSLIGADVTQFRPPAVQTEPGAPISAATGAAPPPAADESEDEVSRWARPDRR